MDHHHQNHQTYDPSSSEMQQAYQYNPSNQAYNNYTYNSQYYYHHQQPQQNQQSYPYYTQYGYTNAYNYSIINNNNNQQQQQLEESTIYPPGVPPPEHANTTHRGGVGALTMPGGTHQHHHGALGTVKGPIDPSCGTSLDHFTARDMQHHLPKQHYKIPQGGPQVVHPSHASTSGSVRKAVKGKGPSAKVWPPRPMAWCELCRVDCNSLEILEQHKNGKKHKKNLKVHDELQKLNKLLVEGQNDQASASESKPENPNHLEKVEGSGGNPFPQENLSSQTITEEKKVEIEQQKVEEAENKEESGRKPKNNNFEYRGNGLKRKMKGGRGGKWIKSYDGSRRPIEPPKPKEAVPLICELCNVKCESPVVFQSHLTGKKHLTNLKRFQGQQTMIGQAALQALYPALQAMFPALQELCQGDITTLVSQLQQQGTLNLQGFFAQSGPSMVSQDQASEAAPATLLALPQPSTFSQEQQESSRAAGGSQSTAVTEAGKSHEPSVSANPEHSDLGPDSNVGHLESKTAESVE